MTKRHSTICKGIAILLMFFHHLFFLSERVEKYEIIFWPFSQNQGVILGCFCKICVAIFVFITGYGYYKNRINNNGCIRTTLKRILKLMFQFWFVYIIFFVIGLFTKQCNVYYAGNIIKTIRNCIIDFCGLAYFANTPTINPTWWYMSLALTFIIIVPLFILLNRNKYASAIILILIVLGCIFVKKDRVYTIFYYLVSLEIGIICSKYSLFEKIKRAASKKHYIDLIISALLLVILSYLRLKVYVTYIVDPLIAMMICFFVYRLSDLVKGASKVLFTFGKYSAVAFMMHTFLINYFMDYLYHPKYFLLIWLILAIVTLACCYCLEKIKCIIRYNKLCEKVLSWL